MTPADSLPILQALLKGIVDYAGFFPPAGLPIDAVVREYANYRVQPESWLLGRLVAPANRLSEFGEAIQAMPSSAAPWRLSVVVPSPDADPADTMAALATVKAFNESLSGRACVDSIECKVESESSLRMAMTMASSLGMRQHGPQPGTPWLYFWEIAPGPGLGSLLPPIAAIRHEAEGLAGTCIDGAKIRTGGVIPSAIPTLESVVDFVMACSKAAIPFKATAGLHHPWRAEHPLTYETEAPCGIMHGFINVFLAAAGSLQHDIDQSVLIQLIGERDPQSFRVQSDSITWNALTWDAADLERCRKNFAMSFGSCSFNEPVADLKAAGWLPQ
jgi:hypothetical protein